MTLSYKIEPNNSDAHVSEPRAVIAIFPLKKTEIMPIQIMLQGEADKIPGEVDVSGRADTGFVISIPSDILALNVSHDKKSPIGTMSAVLSPGNYNYLAICNPGDFIFVWITPDSTTADDLISKIQTLSKCNDVLYGLKFFGKIYSIEEDFAINGGIKSTRYNVSAQSFDWYHSQVFNSPYLSPLEVTDEGKVMYTQNFFADLLSGLTEEEQNELFNKIEFNAQYQVVYLHRAFMSAREKNVAPDDSLFKAAPNMFILPPEIGKLFGGTVSGRPFTFSDLINVYVGIQQFDNGDAKQIGFDPSNFDNTDFQGLGEIFTPSNEADEIQGVRIVNMAPNMGGSIWEIIKEHSDPLINEMYTTLRVQNNNIYPTFVCRQLPFTVSWVTNEQFNTTLFSDLPRFLIDTSQVISYQFNKNNEFRINMFYILPTAYGPIGTQADQSAISLSQYGYQIDLQDAKLHGNKVLPSQVYEQIAADDPAQLQKLTNYQNFLQDVNGNLHIKLNGVLTTWGINDPICVGENLQLGDKFLFHIEKITHNYVVESGRVIFRTSFELSRGLHLGQNGGIDGDLGEDNNFHPNYDPLPPYTNQGTVTQGRAIKGGIMQQSSDWIKLSNIKKANS